MEKLRNDPFPYCHLYHINVGNKHGKGWMYYTLHCDRPNPTHKDNINEIHRRLGWSSTPLQIFNIKVIKKDYNGQSQEQQHIKLHKEASQKATRNSFKMQPLKIKKIEEIQKGL